MALDDFLSGLHADDQRSVEEQLAAIERELAMRHALSVMTTTTLFDQHRKLRADILTLFPEHPGAVDVHRRDRQALEREARAIEQLLDREATDKWRDEQSLQRERRELSREHREEEDSYTRLSDAYR